MMSYYLRLAFISMRRNPVLSSLMVLAIALGIGACMTTITVNYLMSNNPIKHKSDVLFHVQLDNWGPFEAAVDPNDPPYQLTWTDATNLQQAQQGIRQAAMAKSGGVVEPADPNIKPFQAGYRLTYSDFFSMFDVPFLYGSAWDKQADENARHLVVLTKEINETLFGGKNSVGQSVTLSGEVFTIVGVIAEWHPIPKFYDLNNDDFGRPSELFIPLQLKRTMKLPSWGNVNCWKSPDEEGFEGFLNSECVNFQFWVELDNPAERSDYALFLDNYVNSQKELGRFPRPLNNRLNNVQQWLEYNEVVADDAQIMMWLSLMFLAVCLLNTIGLMLSKFMGKSSEIGLRRAVGATKGDLFIQHTVETACIGVAGGLLGLGFSFFGLQGLRALYGEFAHKLTSLDMNMAILAVVIALVSTILAGLYPTWRACSIAPASQLKSQ
ncbi:ABC transporter permease [Planctobacterium marinum]|uniref:ABC transporter permease n=1 Tax=Planctobacterium marinum TaxID=1631968 RepID=UPI001E63D372|nr:ABC transporter permease [Planctobacterium marinum]MCC2603852.1 ABC transporter permease [Planctobacterium marinum]